MIRRVPGQDHGCTADGISDNRSGRAPSPGKTWSVCPQCLRRIPAQRVRSGQTTCLTKICPEHGSFTVPIWHGAPDFNEWIRPKTPYSGGQRQTRVSDGCPYDCGLCPGHHQRSCTVLVEVTQRCNLHCPICYADSGSRDNQPPTDPSLSELRQRFSHIIKATGGCNLQLSGGEPTVRDDLPEIVAAAREAGFSFVQVNTNGLRLADDQDFVHRLRDAGLSSLFLQFDTLRDEHCRTLRGKELVAQKIAVIKAMADTGIGVVLVATVVRDLNDAEAWELCRFALDNQPTVRGVHFQPASQFGRFPRSRLTRQAGWTPDSHLTLPELMRMLVEQSGNRLQLSDFNPPGCEHALCSFSARYLNLGEDRLARLGSASCTCSPQPAEKGALRSIDYTARQWTGPAQPSTAKKLDLPLATCATTGTGNQKRDDLDQGDEEQQGDDLDRFLARARTHTFSLSAMAFQDCWNLDLERLQGCCIHVAAEGGRLIPFCAYNLTSLNGESLYRGKV